MTNREFKDSVISLSDKLFRIAHRLLGDNDEAKDAVQDSIIKLWKTKSTLSKLKSIEAFSVTVTKNVCLDRLRARKYNTIDIEQAYDLSDKKTPEQQSEITESVKQINSIIKLLPEQQRLIIQLRDIEGYAFEEIEKMTGISVNTIRVNLSRARKAVRDQLTKTYNYGLKNA